MRLEVIVIPVSDVERAKRFYEELGWRLDADIIIGDDFRSIQFTPPGSPCSIHFGKGVTSAMPGSAQGLYLVVSDIQIARTDLALRGVEILELFHIEPGKGRMSGLDPARRSYASYAAFRDPDGNRWLVQEVTARLPGRVDVNEMLFLSQSDLTAALRRAQAAYLEHEKQSSDLDRVPWAAWYAQYIATEHSVRQLNS